MRRPRALSANIANQFMRFAKFGQVEAPAQASRHIEVAEHRRLSTLYTLDIPDFSCIFSDSTIAREFPYPGHVQDRLTCPYRRVFEFGACLFLRFDVRRQIRQVKIFVSMVQDGLVNPAEQARLMRAEEIRVK